MCGIIGYVGTKKAVSIITEGLEKLEYRGYDSAGLAVHSADGFKVVKQKGRLAALEKRLQDYSIEGTMGIGHTRWATHGEPSDINSHPHIGERNTIAVVHNGIIENYKEIKEWLQKKGIAFVSQTDSEVVAQLAEYYYKGDIIQTTIKVCGLLEGSYALGIMHMDDPDTLIAVKKDNPLIVGESNHGHFIASDVPAILKHTDSVYYLNDFELALLKKDSVSFLDFDRKPLLKKPEKITWSAANAEKGNYAHFMLKEIMEQPKVLRDTIHSTLHGLNRDTLSKIDVAKFNKVVITACGSAYNAGFVGKYVLEKLCRLPNIEVELASEFRYKDAVVDDKTLVILISQSGETADTIAAMREAKAKGAATLAIVNAVGSTLTKETDYCLFTLAGPEIAVATTKAFSAQLILLYGLAAHFAAELGTSSKQELAKLLQDVAALPDKVAHILKQAEDIKKYADTCTEYSSIFFIGRNIDYAIAQEGSLKLKEISYMHSEAYAGGELKHGTISLIEDNILVIAIASQERLHGKILSNTEQVISRGAKVLLIGNTLEIESDEKLNIMTIPECNEILSPSLSIIILQLFSYYVAAKKGLDIDKPRNLAKSVTVE